MAQSELVPPLLVEWDAAIGQVLGDFTWSCSTMISEACSQRMKTELGLQFRTEPVKTVKERVHKQPPPSNPEQGGLLWLRGAYVGKMADCELGQSAQQRCRVCGKRTNTVLVGEMLVRQDRAFEFGLFEVPEHGGGTSLFAAEAVADRLRRAGFSNLALQRAGDLV